MVRSTGNAHSGLGPPSSTTDQENAPTDSPTGQSDEGIFLIGVPSSQMTLVSVKLAKI